LGLRKRAFMLVMVIIVVIAAVVVYIVRMVRPKRVRLRAGVGKITLLDFEADGGEQSHEETKQLPLLGSGESQDTRAQQGELPPGRHRGR
jgi:hypothetical protein